MPVNSDNWYAGVVKSITDLNAEINALAADRAAALAEGDTYDREHHFQASACYVHAIELGHMIAERLADVAELEALIAPPENHAG